MTRKIVLPALCFLLIFAGALCSLDLTRVRAASTASGKTLILYDAALGAIPSTPLVGFTDFPPGAALPAYADGLTVLDTTPAGSDTYAGWVASGATTPGFPILDRTAGFQVNFTLQVEHETHANQNRAGFSVIILGEDAKGVELGFWQDQIWAQSDDLTGGLFKHGEGAAFATTTGLTEYQATVTGDTYILTANAQPILSGPLRDYGKFDGFPDPYETPNFLFLGDDTTSAQARVRLSFLSVTGTEPVTPTATTTITSTSSPLPAASPTPLPSITPLASPAPPGKAPVLCPSGWILLSLTITTVFWARKIQVGHCKALPKRPDTP
jgi:hypothetical protein